MKAYIFLVNAIISACCFMAVYNLSCQTLYSAPFVAILTAYGLASLWITGAKVK